MRVEDLSKKYGYHKYTIRVLLCRAEFSKYTDEFGNITSWDDIADERMERIIKLKERGTKYGYSG